MPLTPDHLDYASRVEQSTIDFIVALNEVDPNSTSEIRQEYINLLDKLLVDLTDEINKGDADEVDVLLEEIEDTNDLIAWNNESALEEFKQLYGNFVEEILNVHNRNGYNFTYLTMRSVWHRYQRQLKISDQSFKVPDEVLDTYQSKAILAVEYVLSREAKNFNKLKIVGALNSQDIISFALFVKPLEFAAISSINFYIRSETLNDIEEEADTSLAEDVWSVVGVDSFSELAFDVAIFVGTGGVSGIYKASRIVSKGIKVLNKARKYEKKVGKTLKATKKSISRAKKQQKVLRERLKKYSKKNKKTQRKRVQRGLQQESQRIQNLYFQAIDLVHNLRKSKTALKEISKALKPGQDVLRGVISNRTAYAILFKDFDSYTDDARVVASKNALKILAKDYHYFGKGIKILENKTIMAFAGIGKGRRNEYFSKWFIRLFWRQLIVYAIIEIVRNKSISAGAMLKITNKAAFAALEETLTPFLPDSLVVKLLSNVNRKVLTGVFEKIGKVIIDHIITSINSQAKR